MPAPARPARDFRIDLFRGLALLMIFIDHIPGNPLSSLTLHRMGFSDAAEVFVLLAGLSATLAYGATFERSWTLGAVRIAGRCWELYSTHIVLLLAVAGLLVAVSALAANPDYLAHAGYRPLFVGTETALGHALTLTYLPNYLDILPLYVVLLALVPVMLPLARRSPAAALAVSLAVYGAARALGLTLPNTPLDGTWFFNPFAWQLLFVIGIVTGLAAGRSERVVPRSPALRAAAWGYLAIAFVAVAPWCDIPGLEGWRLVPDGVLPAMDKADLSPWRLLHALALVYAVVDLIPADTRLAEWAPARAVALCGAQALPVFCIGTVLSRAGEIYAVETGGGAAAMVSASIVGVAVLLLSARVAAWYRAKPWRRSGETGTLPVRGVPSEAR
ncbi:OpgC family protein [Azospirillum halopraeferens]|uniref:OpgC family protein n=1 Tax=Azospirillum halopraeferens TaxID=34010 RepID=UPI00040FBED8|nr:OpgC domain-containing protein [Azospirillum halopraeferens]